MIDIISPEKRAIIDMQMEKRASPDYDQLKLSEFLPDESAYTDEEYNDPETGEIKTRRNYKIGFLIIAKALITADILSIRKYLTGKTVDPEIKQILGKLEHSSSVFNHFYSFDDPVISNNQGLSSVEVSYKLCKEASVSQEDIDRAIQSFLSIVYLPGRLKYPAVQQSDNKQHKGLFPNSKSIDIQNFFGIPKSVGDGLNKVLKNVNRIEAMRQYKDGGRRSVYKTKDQDSTELHLDANLLGIRAAEQFADELIRIKDAKVLQTFFALWKYSNDHDSFYFRDVPISDVMRLVLRANAKANFNTEQRKQFSDVLKYLSGLTITLKVKGERTDKKGKKKTVLREEKGVKLFRLVSEYAVKKPFQHLTKEELEDEHFDKEVITRFTGELLPGYSQLFSERASIYFNALLQLDANKDRTAIILGFVVQTRFNQLQDKCKPIEMERGYMIELCDFQKTDQNDKSVATSILRKVLDKLRKHGIISRYENLTSKDSEKVIIYPADIKELTEPEES